MKKTKWLCMLLAGVMAMMLAGCKTGDTGTGGNEEKPVKTVRYEGPFSEVNGTYAGVDDLGRVLPGDTDTAATKSDRKVGIFYFLWQGQHGTDGPYDNHKIVTEHPEALESSAKWIKAGGGQVGAHHFWGEPLFGYYQSSDVWVMRKHVQMLTDAGVDFLVFDATNSYTYSANCKKLIGVWYEYLEAGYDVPKLAFYTHSSSGATINALYKEIYNNKTLINKYPRLSELWYQWDGKPMVVGDSEDSALSDECKEYFRIKASVWPNGSRTDDGFPWMEFGRVLTPASVYGLDGRKEVMNVSIAQHSQTCMFSLTAWYGMNDRTRSWHNGANDTSENAIMYGYNFAEQWEYAISQDPEMIFVTGWNEWVAQRQNMQNVAQAIQFVDCADPNNSRDSEPMRGIFGDNYYIQLCHYIRLYKGTDARVNIGGDVTIDVNGGFDQWDNAEITAKYTDYKGDTVDRNSRGFGSIKYTDKTGRNDFTNAKVAKDKDNLYFYVDTAEDITASSDPNWMTLFIKSGIEGNANWYGYDYAVNVKAPSEGSAVLSKCSGDWAWEDAGNVAMKVEGNKMMIAIPRELIGVGDNDGKCVLDIQFKWADNYQFNEDGIVEIWSFYTNGDCAPYGRLNYVFSEKPKE